MSHKNFQSDKNDTFLMVGIDGQVLVAFGYDSTNNKSIIFICFKILMIYLIQNKFFTLSLIKKMDKRKL